MHMGVSQTWHDIQIRTFLSLSNRFYPAGGNSYNPRIDAPLVHINNFACYIHIISKNSCSTWNISDYRPRYMIRIETSEEETPVILDA